MRGSGLSGWKIAGAALLCALLAGCATTQRIDAAGDVHAFLISIRDGDRATFDAHVDRPAVERQLESIVLRHTGAPGASDTVRGLGAVLAQPLARLAGEALLRPRVFRSVAEYYGYRPEMKIPGQLAIAGALRALPDGRVCAAKSRQGPCLITFANEAGVWKLVSFDGDVSMLQLPK